MYIRAKIGELRVRRSPWGFQILKCIKTIVTFFLCIVCLSAVEFHDEEHRYVACLKGFWWSLVHFPGSKIFDSEYLAHFLSERDEIWHYYGSGQWSLIPPNLGELWSHDTMQRH